MENNFNFNTIFGSRWNDHITKPLLISVLVALTLVYSVVIYLANLNYSQFESQNQALILDQYKRMVSELIIDQEVFPITQSQADASISEFSIEPQPERMITADEREKHRSGVEQQMAQQGVFSPGLDNSRYDYLPDFSDAGSDALFKDELVIELSRRSGYSRIHDSPRNYPTNYEAGEFDEPFEGLYNYVIKRQGNAYINLTPELRKVDVQEFGYRDPDEIQRVIADYRPMIEYCFRKGTNTNAGMQGFVKVQFNISYNGMVIGESIRILNSSINNRQVEQCIKNYIKRWRNFEVLDESMGIARVTQKFIFN